MLNNLSVPSPFPNDHVHWQIKVNHVMAIRVNRFKEWSFTNPYVFPEVHRSSVTNFKLKTMLQSWCNFNNTLPHIRVWAEGGTLEQVAIPKVPMRKTSTESFFPLPIMLATTFSKREILVTFFNLLTSINIKHLSLYIMNNIFSVSVIYIEIESKTLVESLNFKFYN